MERPQAVRTRTRRRVAALGSLAGVLLLLAAAVAAPAQAAPGDLDLTFSGDGKQTTDFGFGASRAAATVRQPDGKIVAVGASIAGDQFAVARYNPNGSLDTSFSGDGTQTTDFGGFEEARGVALQADGKIVAVGVTGQDFALARYNPNGSLDPSFSGDGRQRTDVGGIDEANGVALQADGKIVTVGAKSTTGIADFALARYNPNGSLDTSFSGDGKQTTDFGSSDDRAHGVALQGGGKIVAVGRGGGDFALARYNPNGSLDTSFSGDGKQTTGFVGGGEASGVALQADGKIVTVGANGHPDYDFALARYNPNGSLDTSFSGDGRQTTDFGGDGFNPDRATGVALQADGKIVAVGQGGQDFALARYNPNGSLDTSFSGDGRQRTDFGGYDEASGVALQADGKIVAVGDADDSPEPEFARDNFALARYNPNGSLDTSFSGDGRQTTEFPGNDGAGDVALQADGKIVTVGTTGDFDFALARYNPNGSLDTSFSGDGRQTIDFAGGGAFANGVALQADGKIVAVGQAVDPGDFSSFFALARFNANGTLDTSFSGDGKQTTNFGGGASANGVALQADGKIVAVGGGDAGFALARYNPNGSLDTTFSGDGKQTTDFGGSDGASDVALQANGRIVAVGGGGPGGNFALARYNPNGALDTGFSGDGKQTTNFVGDFDDATGVAIQGDGKIVAVGSAGPYPNNPSDFALARYNPNGSIDTSFSGDGKRVTDFSGDSEAGDAASGVAIQGDGKIVAAGLTGGPAAPGPTGNDFALARYTPNGSLDTTFAGGGKRRTNFGGLDAASGVALQGNGRIVLAGYGLGTDGTGDFALARYLGG